MRRDFKRSREIGRVAEDRVAAWLETLGLSTLRSYLAGGEDKAPRLQTPQGTRIVPDLLGFDPHDQRWFEVKWKQSCTSHFKSGTMQTGFDARHHTDYLAVQATTGIEVVVLFLHEEENEVRGGALDVIDALAYSHTAAIHGKPVRFYRWHDLQRFAKLSDLPLGAS